MIDMMTSYCFDSLWDAGHVWFNICFVINAEFCDTGFKTNDALVCKKCISDSLLQ